MRIRKHKVAMEHHLVFYFFTRVKLTKVDWWVGVFSGLVQQRATEYSVWKAPPIAGDCSSCGAELHLA